MLLVKYNYLSELSSTLPLLDGVIEMEKLNWFYFCYFWKFFLFSGFVYYLKISVFSKVTLLVKI